MKLNEAKFIAEIRRLAISITNTDDIDKAKTNADGIISICNILDVDLPTVNVMPADYDAKVQTPFSINMDSEIFTQAQEEQHGGDSK